MLLFFSKSKHTQTVRQTHTEREYFWPLRLLLYTDQFLDSFFGINWEKQLSKKNHKLMGWCQAATKNLKRKIVCIYQFNGIKIYCNSNRLHFIAIFCIVYVAFIGLLQFPWSLAKDQFSFIEKNVIFTVCKIKKHTKKRVFFLHRQWIDNCDACELVAIYRWALLMFFLLNLIRSITHTVRQVRCARMINPNGKTQTSSMSSYIHIQCAVLCMWFKYF